ncbi:hypothetical protein [uncultured Ramlibacter sp.]|uniref:hypothetical protein n=1 Tax=uncultured Ramlibacter sp. TaxID=260755 RepID=UPI0026056879|nr:hypothetical protein [uncultured Ramlibacter sp.]
MKKHLLVSMLACVAAFSHPSAHAEWSCGGAVTQKLAKAIASDMDEIELTAKLLLNYLIIDATYNQKIHLFSIDGGANAISALQRGAAMTAQAWALKDLVEIRDQATGKTKQQLEKHINRQLSRLRERANDITDDVPKLRQVATSKSLAELEKLDRFSRNIVNVVKDCED